VHSNAREHGCIYLFRKIYLEDRVMNANRVRLAVAGLAAGALLLSACAGGMGSASKAEFDTAYAEASAAFNESVTAEHAWSTAEDALNKAKEEAENGNYAEAIKLANKSKSHSVLAIQQARTEAQAPTTAW
jgi:ABC-type glycerol-3-phosphate transport system substrate-binding protein